MTIIMIFIIIIIIYMLIYLFMLLFFNIFDLLLLEYTWNNNINLFNFILDD